MRKNLEYVENAIDYIEEIIEIKGNKICIVNCEDWFQQYENENCRCGWFTPCRLLSDCDLYLNIAPGINGNTCYHGIAIYSTEDSFMEEFYDYDECIAWLIDDEDDDDDEN